MTTLQRLTALQQTCEHESGHWRELENTATIATTQNFYAGAAKVYEMINEELKVIIEHEKLETETTKESS